MAHCFETNTLASLTHTLKTLRQMYYQYLIVHLNQDAPLYSSANRQHTTQLNTLHFVALCCLSAGINLLTDGLYFNSNVRLAPTGSENICGLCLPLTIKKILKAKVFWLKGEPPCIALKKHICSQTQQKLMVLLTSHLSLSQISSK